MNYIYINFHYGGCYFKNYSSYIFILVTPLVIRLLHKIIALDSIYWFLLWVSSELACNFFPFSFLCSFLYLILANENKQHHHLLWAELCPSKIHEVGIYLVL